MSIITKQFAVSGAIFMLATAGQVQASCNPNVKPTNFEQFKRCVYQEPNTSVWIVDGDIPITTEAGLRKFYEGLMASPTTPSALGSPSAELIVNRVNNADDVWSDATRCSIRYCVSQATTGARYQEVVNAMTAASNAWSNHIGVSITHVANQDGNCTAQNAQVVFDVQVVNNQPYLARAFFPSDQRATRNININTTSFAVVQPPLTLEGILRHELGHVLGFRHEHTRPETGQCFENNSWRPLTPYDSDSVMHYPQCGGTGDWGFNLTNNDIAGAVLLYGNQANCGSMVTIYQDASYSWVSKSLSVGNYDINQLGISNDSLSSLKVPSGMKVTLYEHAGFQGKTLVITDDTVFVGDSFNDKTSSIKVESE